MKNKQRTRRIQSVTLAYFSGTGCTKVVADCFEQLLRKQKIAVSKINITAENRKTDISTDLLIVLSPVYAFRMVSVVEKWVGNLSRTSHSYAAVISVSGGGDCSPNTACRIRSRALLRKKGYRVIFEKMFVMPSNIAIQAEESLNLELIRVLPQKVSESIDQMLSGKTVLKKPVFIDRMFAVLGRAEHFGAAFFGASIHASDHCSSCGKCARLCPQKNIRMKQGRPVFGFHCLFCLKCIYGCPQNALSPRILGFAILKNGFDIRQWLKKAGSTTALSRPVKEKSLLWQGVIDYLNEK